MLTDWLTRPLRAALTEIGVMRQERDWARLDGMVSAVEAKIASLNDHHANQHSGAQLEWQRGRLSWDGRAPSWFPDPGPFADRAQRHQQQDRGIDL